MQLIKKPFIPVVMIISGIILGAIVSSALFTLTGFSLFGETHRHTISADETKNADMTLLAYEILEHISENDFVALSKYVHPEFGLVLSPSATINLTTDRRFSAEQIANLDSDSSIYVWGTYNGSGKPIEMKPTEYFSEYVPAKGHMDASVIGINQIVRSGNALENITDVFPNVRYVDFHMPGADKFAEYDWSSLRLGFEEFDGELMLVVITHSAWTD